MTAGYFILANGGGTNSTAMLVGLHERGMRLDGNVFADTGDEKPETYAHLAHVSDWCESVGFPRVEVLRGRTPQQIKDASLSAECLRLETLPSKAFGFSSCSMKWKVAPQRLYFGQFAERLGVAQSELTVFVGFDADEQSRIERGRAAQNPTQQRYLLDEWGWGREECIAAIARAGLTQPGKSACFFCPSSKKHEILALRRDHPELLARALEMERLALASDKNRAVGLGRSFNWAAWLNEYDAAAVQGQAFLDAQLDLFSNAGIPELDCACGAAA